MQVSRVALASLAFRAIVVLSFAALAGALSGCKSQTAEPNKPVPLKNPQSVREAFLAANPNARVGKVIAVIPQASLASVGDVPIADFHEGDAITFIVGENQYVQGVVLRVVNDKESVPALHVHYDMNGATGRAPRIDDLAVHVISGPIRPMTMPTGIDASMSRMNSGMSSGMSMPSTEPGATPPAPATEPAMPAAVGASADPAKASDSGTAAGASSAQGGTPSQPSREVPAATEPVASPTAAPEPAAPATLPATVPAEPSLNK
jgi:hypothetical protein